MSRRKFVIVAAGLLLIMAVFAVAFDPSARVRGWVNHEPFFEGRAATAWRRDLRSTDELSASSAAERLATGKSASLPVCTWLLRNASEPQVRARAADALGKMGKDAAPAGSDLVTTLTDADPLVRSAATRVVGDLGPDVEGAVTALIGLFPDREALRAVAKFRQKGAAAVPKLIELTKHEDVAVRRQAVRTLGRIGPPSLPALPRLIEMVTNDSEPGVREFAATVIGEFGTVAAPGIPALARALGDSDVKVRLEAVKSLGLMGREAADVLVDVVSLQNDPEESVRAAAKRAARLIDPKRK